MQRITILYLNCNIGYYYYYTLVVINCSIATLYNDVYLATYKLIVQRKLSYGSNRSYSYGYSYSLTRIFRARSAAIAVVLEL